MTISSMTGFARASGALGPLHWQWEAKSVNGKALDVRCRLPTGFEALEIAVRAAVATGSRLPAFIAHRTGCPVSS